jgi:dehydrogenase/reductase SDR family protein 7B
MSWDRKRVWITGASSGIGEGVARVLDRRGARLVLSARRSERLEAVRASLTRPDAHEILALDVAETDRAGEHVGGVLAQGPVDVLVHSAGISQRSRVVDTDLSVDRRLMEVNYFGVVALTKAVLPSMLDRGSGHFVVVSSLVGKISTPKRSGYSASKHALHGFFDALRAELHDRGIRVTIACPGFIRTELPLHALVGDGSEQGRMDEAQEQGMAPEVCAERMVRAVEAGKREVLIGGREVWAVRLHRFFPGLFHRMIRTAKVT